MEKVSPDIRRERRRESNRLSKRRCRERRLARLEILQGDISRLLAEFNSLQTENAVLRNELLGLLRNHRQQGHVGRSGMRLTESSTPRLDNLPNSAPPVHVSSLLQPDQANLPTLSGFINGSSQGLLGQVTSCQQGSNRSSQRLEAVSFDVRSTLSSAQLTNATRAALMGLGPMAGLELFSQDPSLVRSLLTSCSPPQRMPLLAAASFNNPVLEDTASARESF